MTDAYQVVQAPPIDSEFLTPRAPGEPLKVTVKPKPAAPPKVETLDDLPDWVPANEAQAARDTAAARTAGQRRPPESIDTLPAWEPAPKEPAREVGAGEAGALGLEHGLSMGAAPALHGLSEASQPALDDFAKKQGVEPETLPVSPHVKAALGAAELLTNWMTGHDDPKVKEAYERGRKRAQENEQLANDQHRIAYLGGVLAGSVAAPIPGVSAIRPAATGGRIVQGLRTGGAAGAAFGAGEEIGKGGSPADVLKGGVKGGVTGAAVGAPLVAAVGPRLIGAAGPGQRAAATAENLGAPIPKGLASDNAAVQASAAATRSMPWFGAKMGTMVDRTQTAAGHEIEGIASTMAGGATDRASANIVVVPGLEQAVVTGRAAQNAAYDGLRTQIDHDAQRFTLPRTQRAIDGVVTARRAAGWPNPEEGLEQAQNVARGVTFDGAHRARTDVRGAGGGRAPNPGYDKADFNRLERAMSADLRDLVQAAAVNQTPAGRRAALDAFTEAERRFGPIADMNSFLHRLAEANGEGAINSLLNAAKEKGGDVRMLNYLRHTMPPDAFSVIGGLLVSEIGHSTRTGEFSLNQFVTNWDKISDGAKRVLFSPAHRENIEEIFNLGSHIKSALKDTNTSHTSNTIILFDLARDAAFLGVGIATGAVSGGGALAGAAAATPAIVFAHWLSSPASVAAMSAWSRAYRGLTMNQPTPARQAVFRLATRNLANTLGVPMDRITDTIVRSVQGPIRGAAEDEQPEPERILDQVPNKN